MRRKKLAEFRPSATRPRSPSPPESLERQKLKAEIESLELRNEAEREKLDQERSTRHRIDVKGWVPIILSALTVGLTAATVGKELNEYLEQQAKQYEVRANEHIIEIAQKLADSNADALQSGTNAVLLSTFEEDALPVLFEHLRGSTATSQKPILHALELIQRKKTVKPGTVTRELLAEAGQVFARYEDDVDGTLNFVAALGRLGADDKQGALRLLAELRQRVHRNGGAPAGILTPMIDEACRQLAGGACSKEV